MYNALVIIFAIYFSLIEMASFIVALIKIKKFPQNSRTKALAVMIIFCIILGIEVIKNVMNNTTQYYGLPSFMIVFSMIIAKSKSLDI